MDDARHTTNQLTAKNARRSSSPGYTFGTVTDKISSIVLTAPDVRWAGWSGFGIAFLITMMLLFAIGYLFVQGRRHLGHQYPGRLGLRHHQLRVVDRYRPRRHADFRHSAAAAATLAQLHQPLRGSHDAVRGGLRGHVPAAAHGPSLAGVLAVSVSQHHEAIGRSSAARWCGTCSRSRPTPRFRCCSGSSD